mmetsp:Transcript_25376/g.63634  ORF Transcript_25376/g.63634 Transcript_25376/m.63634 type:complete len:312 (-) Transcript_25376:933-1868(-)
MKEPEGEEGVDRSRRVCPHDPHSVSWYTCSMGRSMSSATACLGACWMTFTASIRSRGPLAIGSSFSNAIIMSSRGGSVVEGCCDPNSENNCHRRFLDLSRSRTSFSRCPRSSRSRCSLCSFCNRRLAFSSFPSLRLLAVPLSPLEVSFLLPSPLMSLLLPSALSMRRSTNRSLSDSGDRSSSSSAGIWDFSSSIVLFNSAFSSPMRRMVVRSLKKLSSRDAMFSPIYKSSTKSRRLDVLCPSVLMRSASSSNFWRLQSGTRSRSFLPPKSLLSDLSTSCSSGSCEGDTDRSGGCRAPSSVGDRRPTDSLGL